MKKLPLLFLLLTISVASFSADVKPHGKIRKRHSVTRKKPDISKGMDFPVAGKRSNIESLWGANRGGGTRKHKGIDIYAHKGTPVVAISDGIIVKKEHTANGGKTLWLKPADQSWTAYYAHLDKQLVKKGEVVRKGQVIGTVGNTGNAATTPSHLHFGIRPGKGWVNPLPFVKHSSKVAAPKLPAGRKANATKKYHHSRKKSRR